MSKLVTVRVIFDFFIVRQKISKVILKMVIGSYKFGSLSFRNNKKVMFRSILLPIKTLRYNNVNLKSNYRTNHLRSLMEPKLEQTCPTNQDKIPVDDRHSTTPDSPATIPLIRNFSLKSLQTWEQGGKLEPFNRLTQTMSKQLTFYLLHHHIRGTHITLLIRFISYNSLESYQEPCLLRVVCNRR